MIKATMVVFTSETKLEVFEPFSRIYEVVHQDGTSYDSALNVAQRVARDNGFDIVDQYFEKNEFDDPITCYFLEKEV